MYHIYIYIYVIEPLNMVVWDMEKIDGYVDMLCEKLSDPGWIMAQLLTSYHVYLVWNIFDFSIYWESSPQLTFIFFRGVAQPPTS